MLEYETLRMIWWALFGILIMGFAVMDGFDIGSAALLPFVGRNDSERRIVINTIGPVWEGNQVWLILGAGSIFAAWPYLYAVAFSGFYLAMFLALASLIARPVSIKFRSKMPGKVWRSVWDSGLTISGIVPPVIFGVAVGNALQGVPFTFDNTMRMSYTGGFLDLLNPFALLCGVLALMMFALQGAAWLTVKTDGPVQKRAIIAVIICGCITAICFVIGGYWAAHSLEGYRITSAISHAGPSNPMLKTVEHVQGAWLDNYARMPVLWRVPTLAAVGMLIVFSGVFIRRYLVVFFGSSLVQIGIIGTAGVSMFPFLLPSSLNPNAGLTIWDASSSHTTLMLMLVVTAIFMPLILIYTSWVYRVMRGKVTAAHVRESSDHLY